MDLQPQRKVGPTRRNVSGVHSFRRIKGIPFESSLEHDFLIRTEFDPGVTDIIAQPAQIPFRTPTNRAATYTPAFLVVYRPADPAHPAHRGPHLVEVTPEREWRRNRRQWRSKWRAAVRHANGRGWTFRIHDESRIRDRVLENVRGLRRYKRRSVDESVTRRILDRLDEAGRLPVRQLLNEQPSADVPALGLADLWHLVASRRLDCDVSRPLDVDTEVWSLTP